MANGIKQILRIITSQLLICPVLLFMVAGCKSQDPDSREKIVAEVYNKKLKAKEVNAFIPYEASTADSLAIAQAYIDRWIKESLLLREAEKTISEDIAIDQLVSRYRASLIMSNYEKLYVEQNLDTMITPQELENYYEDNKYQYQLETTILKCRFLKIERVVTPKEFEFLNESWASEKSNDIKKLKTICKEFGEQCFFEEEMEWLKLDLLQSMLPQGSINENIIRYNKTFELRDEDYYYYLRIYEQVADKEVAPFSFIEEQARRFILHQRKLVVLDRMREELYEKEMELNNVKVHTD